MLSICLFFFVASNGVCVAYAVIAFFLFVDVFWLRTFWKSFLFLFCCIELLTKTNYQIFYLLDRNQQRNGRDHSQRGSSQLFFDLL